MEIYFCSLPDFGAPGSGGDSGISLQLFSACKKTGFNRRKSAGAQRKATL
jgi:hypothetical protein